MEKNISAPGWNASLYERLWFLCFFLIIVGLTGNLVAGPSVNEETIYYDVRGATVQELRANMNTTSPITFKGKKYDAYTDWKVNWNFWWDTLEEGCAITSVEVILTVTFTYPRWLDRQDAPPALQSKWERYLTALIEHEEGHKAIGLACAREIEERLSEMSPSASCELLEQIANDLADTILQKHINLEKDYDRRTDHGQKTGAVFP
ncbi:DUF922 domain-containing Zn-dependent protease [bacterium]|nr:DUF922 domain-containing Zn-dependent protease [bacterium]